MTENVVNTEVFEVHRIDKNQNPIRDEQYNQSGIKDPGDQTPTPKQQQGIKDSSRTTSSKSNDKSGDSNKTPNKLSKKGGCFKEDTNERKRTT